MLHTRIALQELFNAGESMSFIFFHSHRPTGTGVTKECLSQWWMQSFTVDGIEYSCAEQYMMAGKARLFNDCEAEKEIMKSKSQGEMKALGRKVKGFKTEVWEKECTNIVRAGNLAKFTQNKDLKEYLLGTGDNILVEAAPRDTVWGIGLHARDASAKNPNAWRGDNLLGFTLMDVRDIISNLDAEGRC